MADQLKEYVIKIRADVKDAQKEINNLGREFQNIDGKGLDVNFDKQTEAIKGSISKVIQEIGKLQQSFDKINADKLSESFKGISTEITEAINDMKTSFDGFAEVFKSGFGQDGLNKTFQELTKQIGDITSQWENMMTVFGGSVPQTQIENAFQNVEKVVQEPIKNTGKSYKKSIEELKSDRQKYEAEIIETVNSIKKFEREKGSLTGALDETLEIPELERALALFSKLSRALKGLRGLGINRDEIVKILEPLNKVSYATQDQVDDITAKLNKSLRKIAKDSKEETKKIEQQKEAQHVKVRFVVDYDVLENENEEERIAAIDRIVEKIRVNIQNKVQEKVAKMPIRIPISIGSFDLIKQQEKQLKEVNGEIKELTDEDHKQAIINEVNIGLRVTFEGLLDNINAKIDEINGQITKTIDVKIRPVLYDDKALEQAISQTEETAENVAEKRGLSGGIPISLTGASEIKADDRVIGLLGDIKSIVSEILAKMGPYNGGGGKGNPPYIPPSGGSTPPPPPSGTPGATGTPSPTPPVNGGSGGGTQVKPPISQKADTLKVDTKETIIEDQGSKIPKPEPKQEKPQSPTPPVQKQPEEDAVAKRYKGRFNLEQFGDHLIKRYRLLRGDMSGVTEFNEENSARREEEKNYRSAIKKFLSFSTGKTATLEKLQQKDFFNAAVKGVFKEGDLAYYGKGGQLLDKDLTIGGITKPSFQHQLTDVFTEIREGYNDIRSMITEKYQDAKIDTELVSTKYSDAKVPKWVSLLLTDDEKLEQSALRGVSQTMKKMSDKDYSRIRSTEISQLTLERTELEARANEIERKLRGDVIGGLTGGGTKDQAKGVIQDFISKNYKSIVGEITGGDLLRPDVFHNPIATFKGKVSDANDQLIEFTASWDTLNGTISIIDEKMASTKEYLDLVKEHNDITEKALPANATSIEAVRNAGKKELAEMKIKREHKDARKQIANYAGVMDKEQEKLYKKAMEREITSLVNAGAREVVKNTFGNNVLSELKDDGISAIDRKDKKTYGDGQLYLDKLKRWGLNLDETSGNMISIINPQITKKWAETDLMQRIGEIGKIGQQKLEEQAQIIDALSQNEDLFKEYSAIYADIEKGNDTEENKKKLIELGGSIRQQLVDSLTDEQKENAKLELQVLQSIKSGSFVGVKAKYKKQEYKDVSDEPIDKEGIASDKFIGEIIPTKRSLSEAEQKRFDWLSAIVNNFSDLSDHDIYQYALSQLEELQDSRKKEYEIGKQFEKILTEMAQGTNYNPLSREAYIKLKEKSLPEIDAELAKYTPYLANSRGEIIWDQVLKDDNGNVKLGNAPEYVSKKVGHLSGIRRGIIRQMLGYEIGHGIRNLDGSPKNKPDIRDLLSIPGKTPEQIQAEIDKLPQTQEQIDARVNERIQGFIALLQQDLEEVERALALLEQKKAENPDKKIRTYDLENKRDLIVKAIDAITNNGVNRYQERIDRNNEEIEALDREEAELISKLQEKAGVPDRVSEQANALISRIHEIKQQERIINEQEFIPEFKPYDDPQDVYKIYGGEKYIGLLEDLERERKNPVDVSKINSLNSQIIQMQNDIADQIINDISNTILDIQDAVQNKIPHVAKARRLLELKRDLLSINGTLSFDEQDYDENKNPSVTKPIRFSKLNKELLLSSHGAFQFDKQDYIDGMNPFAYAQGVFKTQDNKDLLQYYQHNRKMLTKKLHKLFQQNGIIPEAILQNDGTFADSKEYNRLIEVRNRREYLEGDNREVERLAEQNNAELLKVRQYYEKNFRDQITNRKKELTSLLSRATQQQEDEEYERRQREAQERAAAQARRERELQEAEIKAAREKDEKASVIKHLTDKNTTAYERFNFAVPEFSRQVENAGGVEMLGQRSQIVEQLITDLNNESQRLEDQASTIRKHIKSAKGKVQRLEDKAAAYNPINTAEARENVYQTYGEGYNEQRLALIDELNTLKNSDKKDVTRINQISQQISEFETRIANIIYDNILNLIDDMQSKVQEGAKEGGVPPKRSEISKWAKNILTQYRDFLTVGGQMDLYQSDYIEGQNPIELAKNVLGISDTAISEAQALVSTQQNNLTAVKTDKAKIDSILKNFTVEKIQQIVDGLQYTDPKSQVEVQKLVDRIIGGSALVDKRTQLEEEKNRLQTEINKTWDSSKKKPINEKLGVVTGEIKDINRQIYLDALPEGAVQNIVSFLETIISLKNAVYKYNEQIGLISDINNAEDPSQKIKAYFSFLLRFLNITKKDYDDFERRLKLEEDRNKAMFDPEAARKQQEQAEAQAEAQRQEAERAKAQGIFSQRALIAAKARYYATGEGAQYEQQMAAAAEQQEASRRQRAIDSVFNKPYYADMSDEQAIVTKLIARIVANQAKFGTISKKKQAELEGLYKQAKQLGLEVNEQGYIKPLVSKEDYKKDPSKYTIPRLTEEQLIESGVWRGSKKGRNTFYVGEEETVYRNIPPSETPPEVSPGSVFQNEDAYFASLAQYDGQLEDTLDSTQQAAQAERDLAEQRRATASATQQASQQASKFTEDIRLSAATSEEDLIKRVKLGLSRGLHIGGREGKLHWAENYEGLKERGYTDYTYDLQKHGDKRFKEFAKFYFGKMIESIYSDDMIAKETGEATASLPLLGKNGAVLGASKRNNTPYSLEDFKANEGLAEKVLATATKGSKYNTDYWIQSRANAQAYLDTIRQVVVEEGKVGKPSGESPISSGKTERFYRGVSSYDDGFLGGGHLTYEGHTYGSSDRDMILESGYAGMMGKLYEFEVDMSNKILEIDAGGKLSEEFEYLGDNIDADSQKLNTLISDMKKLSDVSMRDIESLYAINNLSDDDFQQYFQRKLDNVLKPDGMPNYNTKANLEELYGQLLFAKQSGRNIDFIDKNVFESRGIDLSSLVPKLNDGVEDLYKIIMQIISINQDSSKLLGYSINGLHIPGASFTNDDFAQKASSMGYDAVIFRNMMDSLELDYTNAITDIIAIFNDKIIKSVKETKLDEDGELIPTSTRVLTREEWKRKSNQTPVSPIVEETSSTTQQLTTAESQAAEAGQQMGDQIASGAEKAKTAVIDLDNALKSMQSILSSSGKEGLISALQSLKVDQLKGIFKDEKNGLDARGISGLRKGELIDRIVGGVNTSVNPKYTDKQITFESGLARPALIKETELAGQASIAAAEAATQEEKALRGAAEAAIEKAKAEATVAKETSAATSTAVTPVSKPKTTSTSTATTGAATESVSAEAGAFAPLEEELTQTIPSAIETKNEAFRAEAALVSSLAQQETSDFEQLADKLREIAGLATNFKFDFHMEGGEQLTEGFIQQFGALKTAVAEIDPEQFNAIGNAFSGIGSSIKKTSDVGSYFQQMAEGINALIKALNSQEINNNFDSISQLITRISDAGKALGDMATILRNTGKSGKILGEKVYSSNQDVDAQIKEGLANYKYLSDPANAIDFIDLKKRNQEFLNGNMSSALNADEIARLENYTNKLRQATEVSDLYRNSVQDLAKAENLFLNIFQESAQGLEKHQKAMKDYSDLINSVRERVNGEIKNGNASRFSEGFEKLQDEINKAINDLNKDGKIRTFNERINQAFEGFRSWTRVGKGDLIGNIGENASLSDARKAINQFIGQNYSKVLKEASGSEGTSGIGRLTAEVVNADGEVQKLKFSWDQLHGSIVMTSQEAGDKFKGSFLTLLSDLQGKTKQLFVYWTAMFLNPYRLIGTVKQLINLVKQYDDAFTEMRKVSDESVLSLREFQEQSFQTANEIGASALTLQKSVADWLRLGETFSEAKKSAEASAILMNVSEFTSIDAATESLVAMSQAFKDLDKMAIIDKLNNIGNNFSISTSDLATSLQKSAGTLKIAGNNMDELIALTTAGNSILQNPDSVGTGLKMIALRLTGTKEAKDQLAELGEEDLSTVPKTKSKLRATILRATQVASNNYKGFDILNDNGNYRSTYEIMQGIADIYKEIEQADARYGTNNKNLLLETVAGKMRSSVAAAIFSNPEMLRDVYEQSQQSEGSALEENEKYLDSISGKMTQITNHAHEIATTVLNSDGVKIVLDIVNQILEVVSQITKNIGTIKVGLAAISAINLQKRGLGLLANSKGPGLINGVGGIISGLFSKNAKQQEPSTAIALASKTTTAIAPTPKIMPFSAPDDEEDLAGAMAKTGDAAEKASVGAATFGTSILSVGKALLSTLGTMALVTAALMAIQAAFTAFSNYRNRDKIAIENGKEAKSVIKEIQSDFEETQKFVDDNGVEFSRLYKGYKEGTLNNDEVETYLNLNKQVVELFPSLVAGYDKQGAAILDLGDNATTASDALKELLDRERELAAMKVEEQLPTLIKGVSTEVEQLKEDADSQHDAYLELSEFQSSLKSGEKEIQVSYNNLGDVQDFLKQSGIDYDFDVNDTTMLDSMEDVTYTFRIIGDVDTSQFEQVASDAKEKIQESMRIEEKDLEEIRAKWKSIIPSLITQLSLYDKYSDLGDSKIGQQLQDLIVANLNQFDWENISDDDLKSLRDDSGAFIRSRFLDPIAQHLTDDNGEYASEAILGNIQKLFNLDNLDLSVSDYERRVLEIASHLEKGYLERVDLLNKLGFMTDNEATFTLDKDLEQVRQQASEAGVDEGYFDNVIAPSLTTKQIRAMKRAYSSTSRFNPESIPIQRIEGETDEEYEIRKMVAIGHEYEKWIKRLTSITEAEAPDGLLSDVFKSEDFDMGDFTSKVDAAEQALQSLREAGSLTAEEKISLMDVLPDVTDFDEKSITSAGVKAVKEYVEELRSYAKSFGLGEEGQKQLETYIQNIIASQVQNIRDTSGLSVEDLIRTQIQSSAQARGWNGQEIAQTSYNRTSQIIEALGDRVNDENVNDILLMLSLDGSMLTAEMDDFLAKYDEYAIEIDVVANTAQFEKDIELATAGRSYNEAALSRKQASGERITVADYAGTISFDKREESARYGEYQIAMSEYLKALEKANGNENDEAVIAKQIALFNAQTEYENAKQQTIEDRNTMLEVTTTDLQNEQADLERQITVAEQEHHKVSEKTYRDLIKNGERQIKNLRAQQRGLDKMGPKYREIQSQIDQVSDSMREWENTADHLAAVAGQNLSSAISSAMSEINSETGLTRETMDSLLQSFDDLTAYDLSGLFYESADGMKLNVGMAQDLIDAQYELTMSGYEKTIAEQNKIIAENTGLQDENAQAALAAAQRRKLAAEQDMAMYQAQYNAQRDALSPFQAWQNATQTKNAGANYETYQGAWEGIKEAYEKGWTNTDDFKTYVAFFDRWGRGTLQAYEDEKEVIKRYITEDDSGVFNFMDDLVAKGLGRMDEDGHYLIDTTSFEEMGEATNMSADAAEMMFGRAKDRGFITYAARTVQEAQLDMVDTTHSLIEETSRYQQMLADGASTEQLEEQRQVIDDLRYTMGGYKDVIGDLSQSYGKITSSDLQTSINQIEALRKLMTDEELTSGMSDGELAKYQEDIIEEIQRIADETGIPLKVNAEGEIDMDKLQEQFDGFEPRITVGEIDFSKVQTTTEQMEELQKGGNVDLLSRPLVDAAELVKEGWEEAGEGIATVYSSTYSNAKGTKAANFTPIQVDAEGNLQRILSPEELQKYAESVIDGGEDYLNLQIGATFTGQDAIQQAEESAQQIHQLQDDYYLSGVDPNAEQKFIQNIQGRQDEIQGYVNQLEELELSQEQIQQLSEIDFDDGEYITGLEDAEDILDNMAKALGLNADEAESLLPLLERFGLIDWGGEKTWNKPVSSIMGTDVGALDSWIRENENAEVDLDFDPTEMSVDELGEKIKEISKLKVQIDADPKAGDEVKTQYKELMHSLTQQYGMQKKVDRMYQMTGLTADDFLDLDEEGQKRVMIDIGVNPEDYDSFIESAQNQSIAVKIEGALKDGHTIEELLNMKDEDLANALGISMDEESIAAAKEMLENISMEPYKTAGQTIADQIEDKSSSIGSKIGTGFIEEITGFTDLLTGGDEEASTTSYNTLPKSTADTTSYQPDDNHAPLPQAGQGSTIVDKHVTELSVEGVHESEAEVADYTKTIEEIPESKKTTITTTKEEINRTTSENNVVSNYKMSSSDIMNNDINKKTQESGGTINVSVNVQGKEQVDALKQSIDDIEGKNVDVRASVYGIGTVSTLNNQISKVTGKDVSINASVNGFALVSGLVSKINDLQDKKVTITTEHKTVMTRAGQYTGSVTGTPYTAHASGTAYNMLNLTPKTEANAAGNDVSIQKTGKSLVNELGQESLIRNGKWYLIPGGMHVETLKKGDENLSPIHSDMYLENLSNCRNAVRAG